MEAGQSHKGFFVTVEGGEGSGKTSLLSHLEQWFLAHSRPVLRTREPGGTPVAEELRSVLLTPRQGHGMLPLTELLIILAARHEHVERVIAPALHAGTTVLCDRYIDSTMAYQAYGRQCSPERVWDLSIDLVPLLPDLTFYLDVSPEVALSRLQRRQHGMRDRLEAEEIHFHERVREGFLEMAHHCAHRIVVLDASLSEEELAVEATAVLVSRH